MSHIQFHKEHLEGRENLIEMGSQQFSPVALQILKTEHIAQCARGAVPEAAGCGSGSAAETREGR